MSESRSGVPAPGDAEGAEEPNAHMRGQQARRLREREEGAAAAARTGEAAVGSAAVPAAQRMAGAPQPPPGIT